MLLLNVNKINGYYGDIQVLYDVSIKVEENEVVSIIGANGAGKSTLLRNISGLLHPASGRIDFLNEQINSLPAYKIVERGLVQIPEGRKLFPFLSVLENLEIGAYISRAAKDLKQSLETVFELFPILKERKKQLARTLSGGEQQMLAIARGLMAKPKLLMFDEPSLGLAPILINDVFQTIKKIKEQGITVLLIEQNVKHSLSLSDRGYVLANGKIVLEGRREELLNNLEVKKAYLGM